MDLLVPCRYDAIEARLTAPPKEGGVSSSTGGGGNGDDESQENPPKGGACTATDTCVLVIERYGVQVRSNNTIVTYRIVQNRVHTWIGTIWYLVLIAIHPADSQYLVLFYGVPK